MTSDQVVVGVILWGTALMATFGVLTGALIRKKRARLALISSAAAICVAVVMWAIWGPPVAWMLGVACVWAVLASKIRM